MENEINSHKHLDNANAFCQLQQEIPEDSYLKKDFRSWVEDKKKDDMNYCESSLDKNEEYTINSNNDKENTQFDLFQRAMKAILRYGQWVGLNPVTAILNNDIAKIRFKLCSWRFFYTIILATFQALISIVSVYNHHPTHPGYTVKFFIFWSLSLASVCTTIIFIQIASKWEILLKEILNCHLDKYIDKGISFWCDLSSIVFLILAIVEYVVYFMWEISEVLECAEIVDYNTIEIIVRNMDPAIFEIGIPYSIPIAILLQVNNIFTSANWTLADVYIICISLYLTSMLKEINKKILWVADKNYLSPSIWGTLREDYSRATRLIRRFDDVFSGLILLSFANNLSWICVQIFNVLDNGIKPQHKSLEECPYHRTTPFHGYERSIYVVFSLIFLIVRFTTMCLVAASVNVASSVPASGLYRVPSCAYSLEMAGTILTYELVLLQLSSEELDNA
ncbi:unnamed protein product [Arctia plantaginis]|uniref:Gustatory receptor n=1 Tax=Arctia plantaginis TaxID=874455 RepID=A0A8S0YPC2_ARCPL|nr:unnamed protein product [Arctia plantaginis]